MKTIGTLYIVATPIGNLEDITLRALSVLRSVDVILCEDTRTSGVLLSKYEIKGKLKSYHSHSTGKVHLDILDMLEQGKNMALISDAGTPTISDPGILLVQGVYERFGDDAKVVPIPGPSALIAALSASGVSSSSFLFLGFLPHKKGRETMFKEIAASKHVVVFYESSHRIIKALTSLAEFLPESREVVVARELTKYFEDIRRGSPAELRDFFTKNIEKQKGEFVVIVSHTNKE